MITVYETAKAMASHEPMDLPPVGDDRLLPTILIHAMNEGFRLKDEVMTAEAEERRLRSQLAVAVERAEIARTRYDQNREFAKDVWATLQDEFAKARDRGSERVADASSDVEPVTLTPADLGNHVDVSSE
jgi:hypothetical protein